MIVELNKPSSMDAALVSSQSEEGLIVVKPRRYSKTQRKVCLFPFRVVSESGDMLDRGFIAVDAKTGKFTIEHRITEVPMELKPEEKKPRKTSEEKKA